MAIDTELAKRLRSYRNFKHLTQKDVAAHLNVPHSAISDIENGAGRSFGSTPCICGMAQRGNR